MIGKIVLAGLVVLELVLIGILLYTGSVRTMDTIPFIASILNIIPISVMAISMLMGIEPQRQGSMEISNYVNLQQIRNNTNHGPPS
jgi:hypothetical protein